MGNQIRLRQESRLPAAESTADKALVGVGRRNKSTQCRTPSGILSAVAALFSPDELGRKSVNPKSF